MKKISQIQLLEDGFQAVFADGTMKLYKELIAVDFDGEADVSYANSQLDFALTGFDVKAAVSAADQSAILEKLNAEAADGVLYINAAQAASLPKSSYSTIFVGDTDAFAKLGNFAGIAETTGAFAAATKGDNAFVITGADFTADSLASTIAHEAGHLMGTVEHDYENDGVTLDDFGTAFSGRVDQTKDVNRSYTGTLANQNNSGQAGGAVHFAAGTMTIGASGSTTSLNNNTGAWGGAISVDSTTFTGTSKLTLTHATLSNNKSVNAGGALNISNGKSSANQIVDISNCVFEGNTAGTGTNGLKYGGAIFADKSSVNINISSSTFTANNAGTSGAAIALRGATASISDSVFTNNTGALVLDASINNYENIHPYCEVSNCKFENITDTILASTNSILILKGNNTFGANVTKEKNGVINVSDNATCTFINTGKVTFQATTVGSTCTFYGGAGELVLDKISMGNGSRIYAGGTVSADGTFAGSTLTTNNLSVNSGDKIRIYGGCDVQGTSTEVSGGGSINTTLDIADGSTVTLYGGARLYGSNGNDYEGIVPLGTVSTTISGGGIFSGFAGNGSQGNSGNVTQGDSTLTITGGSFTNYVYAGAYSQGSVSVVQGNTKLTIQGGTFDKVVFGGCAANTNKQARTTKVTGSTNITVDATGDNTINFKSHLIAGSQSCMEEGAKQILGGTTITFKGKGNNITFADDSYVLGGSMLDKKYGCNSVEGDRTLIFDGYTDTSFKANLDETFDTVKFVGSSVTLTGEWESLKCVSTWEFDVSDGEVDLTWVNEGPTNYNDFTDDTINLRGWNGETQTFMTGTNAILKGFDPANVHVYGVSPDEEIMSGFEVKQEGNSLKIIAQQA